jgi:hypothetical protein
MSVVTQMYFHIVGENNYMFRPFSWWAIMRLRLEYRRKLLYCNVDIKNGGTRSRFTIIIHTTGMLQLRSSFFLQFENTVVLRRTFIHLISTIIK